MCGITGFFDTRCQMTGQNMKAIVHQMADTIQHRGPDDFGAWVDETQGIALGFRRLAILDLSPTGHQPMHSASGRFTIVFNGEVYNFLELRRELEAHGVHFRGSSDTEVMLSGIERWGLQGAVQRFNGMFAFALWDRQERRLSLVRDRVGIKPLYYGWMGSVLLFGSELKTLRAYPSFQAEIDRDALALYMRDNCVPAPYSIYRGVYKLPPGAILQVNHTDTSDAVQPQVYWSVRQAAESGLQNRFSGSDEDALRELDELLRTSVRERMIADVPLGAFLSGGVDSSVIVALMQAQSSIPVRTFTMGFEQENYNEAEFARAVARHLGTEHTEMVVSSKEAQNVIPLLPCLYDEPFGDSSQIPTYLVSKLARQHVTVSLSGDGGDELFGGYYRYTWVPRVWRSMRRIPQPARGAAAAALGVLSPENWQKLQRLGGSAAEARMPLFVDKVQKLRDVLPLNSVESIYDNLTSHWKASELVVKGGRMAETLLTDRSQWAQLGDDVRWMMFMDMVTYLPDDILNKVDRASMGVSLEARVPLLDDHRVVEFAWRLPLSMKIRDGQGKWLLRQVLYQYLPQKLIERPKRGFNVPIDEWLRGPLREWAETLLAEDRLNREGFFIPDLIRRKWRDHLDRRYNWQSELWDVLMFQAWLETQ